VTPAEFQEAWSRLKTPVTNQELEATEISAGSGVWVARDNGNYQHLLVLVDGKTDLGLDETHGLKVAIAQHRIAGRGDASYVDLVCLDSGAGQTFAVVATEIANATVSTPIEDRTSAVAAAVREWRWFWGVDPTALSRKAAVGLFGELWFLTRWAGVTSENVTAWDASNGARHDFQWPLSSVEVKTTAQSGAVVHTIQHLEQLDDPESGRLFLYSLRISRDALAANSVKSLAAAARHALRADAAGRSDLMAKLAQRGYSPAGSPESDATYRVLDEGLYRVSDGFPRLTTRSFSGGLPTGITRVSYQVDMSACAAYLTGASPDQWTPENLPSN